jgi:phytoene desaturase
MTVQKKRVAVIGSGIAGIAVAVRLAQKGYQVTVFEKNSFPGGKLSQFERKGYRFDFGPSLFTLPENVEELFRFCNREVSDYFRYEAVNPGHRYFYEDGTVFDAYHPIEKFAEEAERVLGEPRANVLSYLKGAEEKYHLTKDMFLAKSLHKVSSYFSKAALKSMLNMHKMDTFQTLDRVHQKKFKDKRLVQFFNRFATYNGSSPYKAPATLSLIPYLELGLGVYYPKGGMYSITASLVRLAEELGVKFLYNEEVKEILYQQNVVQGIRTATSEHPFEKVVSNMDVYYTYEKLLPTLSKPERTLKQEKSYAAIVFYWGIRRQFPELLLHNIFWSESYQEEFDTLVNKKWVHSDPTIYLNISSKKSPADAPEGCENWFVMVNAPHHDGQDWDKLVAEVRTQVVAKLNRILKTDVEPLIETEEVLHPALLQQKTMSAFGALYGNSSNSKFASFLRHANFHSKIKNLYFCGGTVHPGGGIPLCLLSAKIVSELIPEAAADRSI